MAGAAGGGRKARLSKPLSKEQGICILCGEEREGAPAVADFVISSARKLRAVLRLPQRHTVCCPSCMEECARRRAGYERKLRNYKLWAGVFFALVVASSFAFSNAFPWVLLPAAMGAIIILALPNFYYFPAFEG
ncbi:MAG: hypothetical protein N3E51_04540 [Candidatus Micrarchaeota archaeon]|nr:hypothetical protein [Candidatus Micrarchaeota archaeon]